MDYKGLYDIHKYFLLVAKVFGKVRLRKLQVYFNKKGHKRLKKELMEKYIEKAIKKIYAAGSSNSNKKIENKKIIWICWWQGIDEAPSLIKACVRSVRKTSRYEVKLIDKNNYKKYSKIDEEIENKFASGIIPLIHFSDILRFNILMNNGGIWIDASVFMNKDFPTEYFKKDIITRKDKFENYYNNPSGRKWSTYFFGGQKGEPIFEFLNESYSEYWSKGNYLKDYFLTDYFLSIAYDLNIANFKTLINELDFNNLYMNDLDKMLNDKYNHEKFVNLMQHTNTYIFKLIYKKKLNEKTSNGEQTFYSRLMDL
ncbi:capsular polysaccharide synthesis protein [Liquorilactobacillus mali]|mgnify:CR=1 FL=1|uniref:capsular polysaccharide synthesis protein n=1 Tax=Liquorilactobacillus mali TaxID=1618 RepID=UPI002350851D|nr:capsular polysaccharide synthesis protein [Liquorilactobacillus mali]MDC7953521.1 capsular polysaccharide synthesis protein [Liquorilactobacillus mali]